MMIHIMVGIMSMLTMIILWMFMMVTMFHIMDSMFTYKKD